MGVYWVAKPFPRKERDGGRAIMRPGNKITLQLRSEAEELLKAGFISRNPVAASGRPELEDDHRTQAVPFFSPSQTERMKDLATKAGMSFAAVEGKILEKMAHASQAATQPNAEGKKPLTAEDAIRAFAKWQGLLPAADLIAEAAEILGEKEEELQAEVYQLAKDFRLSVADAITRLQLARKVKMNSTAVCRRLSEMVADRTVTPRDAMTRIEKEATEQAPKSPIIANSDPAGRTAEAAQAAAQKAAADAKEQKRQKRRRVGRPVAIPKTAIPPTAPAAQTTTTPQA
jgi:hypothetical protein